MYPFGSGMTNNPNAPPYPMYNNTSYPANTNQPPYPMNNQAPYPSSNNSSHPYPPVNQTSFSSYPSVNQSSYLSNNQPPYPTVQTATAPSSKSSTSTPYNSNPYPPSVGSTPYPSNKLNANYPPNTESTYQNFKPLYSPPRNQAPYPPPATTTHTPYNHSNQTPYPTFGSGMCLPNTGHPIQPPMFGFGGGISGIVSQPQPPYPSQSHSNQQQINPYPPSSTYNCPYPPQIGNRNGSHPGSINTVYPDVKAVNCQNTYSQTTFRKEKGTPIVVPTQNFDPMADANALRKAMKGFGTDEDALINVICHRSNEQRQVIQQHYKTNFGKDLIEDIKSETSGNFEKLLVALLTPTLDYYLKELHNAMEGIGTDEDVLIEVLCSLSNHEINTIKQAYHHKYRTHLDNDLMSETSGHFKRLLVSLCVGGRDENTSVDQSIAQTDATDLLRAGELMVGTDESTFNMILCRRSFPHLKMVCEEYQRISGHSLEKAIQKEFSGDIKEGLTAIVQCVGNKHEFFASRLHKSMAGIGTNDNQLIRVIVTRSEIDLQDVKVAFEKKYGKSLKSWIKGDTSGHYKHCLYELIGEQRS